MDEMRKRGRHLVQYFCRCTFATGHVTLQITRNINNPDLKITGWHIIKQNPKSSNWRDTQNNSAKLSFNVRGHENQ